ncbi:MAG: YegP family protein [Oscillospiraceae bacterium]|nr:YegP family protein [Oscillospiraceae bacterium]
MGKYVIHETKNGGTKFDLTAGNGEIVAVSEVYSSMQACLKGVESVRRCAPDAAIEDQTVKDFETKKHPKFEIYQDKAKEFRFRLKARNGEIIAVSEGYRSKVSCVNGIASVKKNAGESGVERKPV